MGTNLLGFICFICSFNCIVNGETGMTYFSIYLAKTQQFNPNNRGRMYGPELGLDG